jgi:uncharacterized protein (TIGR04141 family)
LMYPRSGLESARLRSVDSKRRGATTMRSRFQASEAADFEVFDVNRLRDVISKANGIPADTSLWGRRIGGGDSLTLNVDRTFNQMGDLCREIEDAHAADDYTDRFDWIDYIQPVSDPYTLEALEAEVVRRLRARQLDDLALAPPEILDWDRVASFRYHFDRPQGLARSPITHPDLRLVDYITGLTRIHRLAELDVAQLKAGHIRGLDGDGRDQYQWTVWKCLVGEFQYDSDTYVLDEGDFFRVRDDYIEELNDVIARIPIPDLTLPDSTPTTTEGDYNEIAAASCNELLLLDQKTISVKGRTTPIEICDLLSSSCQLIHVKRHLASSTLSHLFAQGFVSAELLHMDPEFRRTARLKIAEVSDGSPDFNLLEDSHLIPSDFQVVYAIIERWGSRTLVQALPFFSKVNLRAAVTNLQAQGFRVGLKQVQAA